ncbi:P-loop containing nucleoside triphosphate hydrolase protein [Kickxella alabastrina]|uniref:P-loop containing nucleoside triphosphate hydrolase protein n=1 Tax=Kickxella alabastrina TaxID=61397 RepID=UPI0022207FA8|nr:P-loop containing nucleoside triphosphate hydrolase protein [Kickxella alabastrina]KAI7827295.1 P-loop containing nucleoside triphosphate hydrolase protein [Kickxella alabastrina]
MAYSTFQSAKHSHDYHYHHRSSREDRDSTRGTNGGASGCLLPSGIVGGIALFLYTKRTAPVYSDAAAAMAPVSSASARLQILHAQASKVSLKLSKPQTSLLAQLVRLLAPECWLLLGVALTAMGAAVVNLWTPLVTGDLINVIARSVRLSLDDSILDALRSPARKLLCLLWPTALDALLGHDMAFFDAVQSGDLAARLAVDIGEFQTTLKRIVSQGVKAATLTVGVAFQLVRLSPTLAGALAATMPPVYVALALYARLLRALRREARGWEGIATGVASEALGGVRTVRALGAEQAELRLYAEARGEAAAAASRFGLHMGAFRGLTNTAVGVMVLVVMYGGGRLAVRAKAAAARVLETTALRPAIPRSGGMRPQLLGHVRPHAPVLSRFNLDIAPGQVVALCGASGGGKSTVAALLERFYDPCAGEIWLDACPLTRLDPAWHRAQIGYIPQDPVLFSTSIRENLRLASPQATDAQIEDACRQANAHVFIQQFPDAYDTVILILDEATSSLDAESERLVQAALDKLMVGRTVLVIAHRLTTIRNADRIVVMGNVPGHIVEQGSHDELIAKRGAYYKLYTEARPEEHKTIE